MRKGFTVAEILITIALITIVSGPLISSFMVGLKSTELMEKDFNMDTLAQELMQEILEKDFEDKDYYGHIGKEEGEVNRIDFDDIDDYDGYIEDFGNIADVSGDIKSEYDAYKRYVEIYNSEQKRITPEDGLRFEYSSIEKLGFNVSDIVLSRDGNRIFGINRNNSRLFAANPFSGDIEDEIDIDELPQNIEISTDSKKIYLNYGYRIDIYSYFPGALSLTSVIKGLDFGKINDIGIFNGKLVIASDRGVFSDGERLNDLEEISFLYFKLDKSVLQSGNKIIIYKNSQLSTPISEKIINDGKKVTSAFYDEYNDRFIFSTDGDYLYLYNIEADSWSNVVNNRTENLNSVFYSWAEGELYTGGVLSNSRGLFKSIFGDFSKTDLIDGNDLKVYDMVYSENDSSIYFLTDNLNRYSISEEKIYKDIWISNLSANSLKIFDNYDYLYMLYDTRLIRYTKSDSSVLFYEGENFLDLCIDNSHIYLTDSTRVIKMNMDFSEPETLKFFTDVEKLIMSKDGKTLFMPSPTTDTIYFLDTFTNGLNSVNSECNRLIQSASGNTIISSSPNKINLIKNTVIESENTISSYTDLINIDKTDEFLAFNSSDKKLDLFEYTDKFSDDFDFFSGYNFYAYFNTGSKGFNVIESNGKVTIDTASAWDSDDGINTGNILVYRTFVFPIPKYLKNINLDMKYSFSGDRLQFFAYAGFLNKDKIESTGGSLSDADVLREIPQGTEFTGEFTIPPTNIITIGFIISDQSQSSYAEFTLDKLTISYNKDNDFNILASYDVPWNSIDCYALSWDNKYLFVAEGNTIHTFDLELAKSIERKKVTISECSGIDSIVVSVDNNTLFAATDNGLYSITEPVREKIIKVMVESNTRNIPPFVIYSTASNWKTTHSTRVIPHILNREFVFSNSEYGGLITKNTVWFPDKQYIVDTDLTIKNGASLLLLPGVNVKFKKDVNIIVESGAKLVARKSVFTSIDDHFRGAVFPEGDGIPESDDHGGIYFQDNSEGLFDGCEIYYSSSAVTKDISAKLSFENSIISECEYGINAAGEVEFVAGYGNVYNTVIKGNKFFDNGFDIYLKNFEGEINSNYFVGSSISSVDISDSPFVRIINNSFILNDNDTPGISAMGGELSLNENDFLLCRNSVKISNTKLSASDNRVVSSSSFIGFSDNSDGKDITLLRNKFIDSNNIFSFSNLFNQNTFKAFLNYFIGCSAEIDNESGLLLNFKYNYWNGKTPQIYTNVQNNPYLLYGLISDNIKFENADILIHNFVRILPSASLEFDNVRPYFFSEYVLPFIDVMKQFNSYGLLKIKNSDLSQPYSPVVQDISDAGVILNTNWKGFRILGKFEGLNSFFDNVQSLFTFYNTDETNMKGADLSEIVYCETGNNTERIMSFNRVTNNATLFNFKAGTVSFNIFRTADSLVSSAIDVDSAMTVPASENKLRLPYNFWNDNYFSEDMLSDFSAYVDILPNAISGKVDGDISIDNVRNPVVAIGDIELSGGIIFSADTPEILFSTDSGIEQKAGRIYKIDGSPVLISDISRLDSNYSKYRYFDFWGDVKEISDYMNVAGSDFSNSTNEIEIGDIENIFSVHINQTNGSLVFENSNIISSRLLPSAGFNDDITINKSNLIVDDESYLRNISIFSVSDTKIGFYKDSNLNFVNNSKLFFNNNNISGNGIKNIDVDYFDNNININPYGSINISFADELSFISNRVLGLKFINTDTANTTTSSFLNIEDNYFILSGWIQDPLISVFNIDDAKIKGNYFGTLDKDFSISDISINSKNILFSKNVNSLLVEENLFYPKNSSSNTVFEFENNRSSHIKGNIFNLDSIPGIIKITSGYSAASVLNTIISENIFLNKGYNTLKLIDCNSLNDIDFAFNHCEGNYYFNVLNSKISIWNNNFGKINSSNFAGTDLDFGGNFFSDNSVYMGFPLQYSVDISKTPDFTIDMDVDSLMGNSIFQQHYLTTDKRVEILLRYRIDNLKYDFGEYRGLFYQSGNPNSLGLRIIRDPKPVKGKYYINYLPYYIDPGSEQAFLELNNSVASDTFKGEFFVNHNGNSSNDNYIKADWSDDLLISLPSTGLLGGGSVFKLPLPAEPNSLPVEPEPPLNFDVVKLSAPYVDLTGSDYAAYDFNGNIQIAWENNRNNNVPIYFYRSFLYKEPETSSYLEEIITTNTNPNINHTINGLEPGRYCITIRAYNANTNYTENGITDDVIGDAPPPDFRLIIHTPPVIEGPLAVDMDPDSGNLSGSNIVISPREGANRYYFQIAKDPDFNTLVVEHVINNNTIPLSTLSFDNGGVYYIRAKAGYSDGVVTEYTEFGEWNPLFVKKGKLLATVINLSTLPATGYNDRISDMLLPVYALNSGTASEKVTHVLIIDYGFDYLLLQDYEKIQKLNQVRSYLNSNGMSDLTYIRSDFEGMYNDTILDGIALSSTYKVSNQFVNLLQGYNGGIFFTDMPGKNSIAGVRGALNSKFGISPYGNQSIAGNQLIYYKNNTNVGDLTLTPSVVSTGILPFSSWTAHFQSPTQIWKIAPGKDVVHCAKTDNPLIIQKSDPNKIFLNFRISESNYYTPYYKHPENKFEISMIEIADRSLRYVLDIAPEPPSPIKMKYTDLADKDTSEPYVRNSSDLLIFDVYDTDGNVKPQTYGENSVPNLSWNLDKNTSFYTLLRKPEDAVSTPYELGYTDFTDFNGSDLNGIIFNPIFNSDSDSYIDYELIATNSWGAEERKILRINYSGIPLTSVSNGVAGGNQTININMLDNNERTKYYKFVVQRTGADPYTNVFTFERNSPTVNITNWKKLTEASERIGYYSYVLSGYNRKNWTDTTSIGASVSTPTVEAEEISRPATGTFSIKPPPLKFIKPQFNIWTTTPYRYEDFDGKFMLEWKNTIDTFSYAPPGQFKIFLDDIVPVYGRMQVLTAVNHGVTFYDTSGFSRSGVPGLHRYIAWVEGFGVPSDNAEIIVSVLNFPQLTETKNSGGYFFINEHDKLQFKINQFVPQQTLPGSQKIIMRLYIQKQGSATWTIKDFPYNASNIYNLSYYDLPSFSKTVYKFRCEFLKTDLSGVSVYDKSKPSNLLTLDFKERFRATMKMEAVDIGKDSYGDPIDARILFSYIYTASVPSDYKYRMAVETPDGFQHWLDYVEKIKSGTDIRNTTANTITIGPTDKTTADRTFHLKIDMFNLSDDPDTATPVYSTGWWQDKIGNDNHGPYTKSYEYVF